MSLSWFFYCVCAMHLVMDFPIYLPCSRHGLASGTSLLSWFYWGILEASECSNSGSRLRKHPTCDFFKCSNLVTRHAQLPLRLLRIFHSGSRHTQHPAGLQFFVTYLCLPRWSGSSFVSTSLSLSRGFSRYLVVPLFSFYCFVFLLSYLVRRLSLLAFCCCVAVIPCC